MEEKILEAFKKLGFLLEEKEEFGYGFNYEGKHFLYMRSDNDSDFLNIAIPAVMDNDDKEDIYFYKVMDKINGTLKYIKAYELYDSMWLFYERELIGDEDLKTVLKNMILRLDNGFNFLHKSISNVDNENDDEDENIDITSIEETDEDTVSEVVDENADNNEDDV